MTDLAPLPLYQGDTWPIAVGFVNADGSAFDASSLTPAAFLIVPKAPLANCRLDVVAADIRTNLAAGRALFVVPLVTTGIIPPDLPVPQAINPDAMPFMTRLRVVFFDAAGEQFTQGVIPIVVRLADTIVVAPALTTITVSPAALGAVANFGAGAAGLDFTQAGNPALALI